MSNLKKEKGITLIALVITVIILLILAGVAMSLITGQNGLFARANYAGYLYNSASQEEKDKYDSIDAALAQYVPGIGDNEGGSQGGQNGGGAQESAIENNMTLSQAKGLKASATNVTIKAPLNEGGTADQNVVIPAGFILASDTGNYVNAGIVIKNATDGNEFVWIPVADSTTYTRTSFKGEKLETYYTTEKIDDDWYYYESQPTDEADSINSYHGFYFGRYETGSKEDTEAKTMRSTQTEAKTVTVQKDQVPYNRVAINSSLANPGTGNMVDLAAALGNGYRATYGGTIKTKLCSSYAWDTALNFVGDSNWARGTGAPVIAQNYTDAPSFEYKKFNNGIIETATKPAGQLSYPGIGIIATGQGTATKNIYDMGGNCWEYTSESFSYMNPPAIRRGSNYYNTFTGCPAGVRHSGYTTGNTEEAFRITLFL